MIYSSLRKMERYSSLMQKLPRQVRYQFCNNKRELKISILRMNNKTAVIKDNMCNFTKNINILLKIKIQIYIDTLTSITTYTHNQDGYGV